MLPLQFDECIDLRNQSFEYLLFGAKQKLERSVVPFFPQPDEDMVSTRAWNADPVQVPIGSP